LVLARVPFSLKADLERHLLTKVIGPARFFDRLHDALAAFAALNDPRAQTTPGSHSVSGESSP